MLWPRNATRSSSTLTYWNEAAPSNFCEFPGMIVSESTIFLKLHGWAIAAWLAASIVSEMSRVFIG
ncbi:MAG: hypothetical protein U0638_14685 [Phycisphaerales bacterium]